ncbi:MAG: MFS transporter [Solirubrobacterales bacterium]|nr:MFS transporter [Solirubrobacterales bacterium]
MAAVTDANRKWWVLVGTSAGLFLLMLDSTVVALALPSVQADLGASNDQLQWVLNAYLLVIAALVVTAGRLGDIFGRRLVFLAGFAVFGAGSVLAAVAWSADALIAGRVVMAIGAASMLPLSLALVTHVFPPAEQPRAIGIWTAVSAIALGIGPLIGGVLSDLDWRLIFVVNVPIVVAAVILLRIVTPEVKDETAEPRIDWPGLALLTLGLGAAVFALVNADDWGWTSAATLTLLAAGLASLVAFWFVEHRVRSPIVEFSLFRNRPYLGATAAAFGVVVTYWTLMFFEPQYLQNILGYTAVEAGLLILPLTVPMILFSPFSGRLIDSFGARATMTAGMTLGVIGLVILTRISGSSGYGLLFPGLLAVGVSLALVYAPMSSAAMMAMPKAKAGIAAAVLAMNRVMAGGIGLAVVSAVFQSLLRSELDSELDRRGIELGDRAREQLDGLLAGSQDAQQAVSADAKGLAGEIRQIAADAFTYALGNAIWVLVGVAAVCTALTWWLVESKRPSAEAGTTAPAHHHHHRFGGFHI